METLWHVKGHQHFHSGIPCGRQCQNCIPAWLTPIGTADLAFSELRAIVRGHDLLAIGISVPLDRVGTVSKHIPLPDTPSGSHCTVALLL